MIELESPIPRQRATLLMLTAIAALGVGAAPSRADLLDDVQGAIRGAQLKSATIAVSIRDSESDRELVSINSERPMIPASNMKLLTTGAALHVLGAGFEFKTQLLRDGDRLIVLADGDPAFGDPSLLEQMQVGDHVGMDIDEFLDLWVKPVRGLGLQRVSEVVVDDRIFDREFVPPAWPVDQLNQSYCAETAGLSIHLNVLHLYPRPLKGQSPNIADVRPRAPWLSLINRGTCKSGAQDNNTAWISRQHDSNSITFYGNVKFAYKVPVAVTVHDAPVFFATLLANRLREAGVSVAGQRVASLDDPATSASGLTRVGPIIQTPLSTILTRCNRDSQNLYAECLLKRVGAAVTHKPGSWLNGATVLRHVVHERVGEPALASKLSAADGSGMSRTNQVAPALLTAWLNSFHRDRALGPAFIDSLAVAGANGTLAKRFATVKLNGATVHAKTGYINQVSCLSGFVTMPDGRRRSFSVMVNELDQGGSVGRAQRLQEAVVSAITKDMASAAAAPRLGGE